jgi:hypothetical protein
LAGVVSLAVVAVAATAAQAAPAGSAAAALKGMGLTQSLADPVHYRCIVRRCGPYRCFWVNRCRRWRRWY